MKTPDYRTEAAEKYAEQLNKSRQLRSNALDFFTSIESSNKAKSLLIQAFDVVLDDMQLEFEFNTEYTAGTHRIKSREEVLIENLMREGLITRSSKALKVLKEAVKNNGEA